MNHNWGACPKKDNLDCDNRAKKNVTLFCKFKREQKSAKKSKASNEKNRCTGKKLRLGDKTMTSLSDIIAENVAEAVGQANSNASVVTNATTGTQQGNHQQQQRLQQQGYQAGDINGTTGERSAL